MASREDTQKFVEELTEKLKEPQSFSFLIPGWEPVDSKQGLWWVTSQLWEGFYVAYRINSEYKQIYLKFWEYGEQEPAWPASANGI